ncbi:MAG: type II secretion system F family protein [Thermoanaerobacteraceae bacterium]|nr:type II secretion system F family protein [Thermoanaerobacteraceae bacterium]
MIVVTSVFIAGWFGVVVLGLLYLLEERRKFKLLLQEAGFQNSEAVQARQKDKLKGLITVLLAKVNLSDKITKYLYQAGLPLRIEEFVALYVLLFITAGILFMLEQFYWAVMLVTLGVLIPPLWVARARRKRIEKFNEQLGEALVLMSNSLKAGFSFMQAMDLVGKEMPPPIGKEFSKVMKEIQLGVPTDVALKGMAKQIASDDLEMVITSVLIQRQVGGNLAEVLGNIATTIKERARIQGEIKTLTAQGKISGLIIGLLPLVLAVILTLINPEYIGVLVTDPVGPFLIAGGVVSQLLGALLIKKIVTIDI